jgi:hypothetical protein
VEKDQNADKGISYLPLNVIIGELALSAKEKKDDYYINPLVQESITKRYNTYGSPMDFSAGSIRKADPFYEAMGQMIVDMVSDEIKPFFKHTVSKADIGALVFVDGVYSMLNSHEKKKSIKTALTRGTSLLSTSLLSLGFIAEEMTKEGQYTNIMSFVKKELTS